MKFSLAHPCSASYSNNHKYILLVTLHKAVIKLISSQWLNDRDEQKWLLGATTALMK